MQAVVGVKIQAGDLTRFLAALGVWETVTALI